MTCLVLIMSIILICGRAPVSLSRHMLHADFNNGYGPERVCDDMMQREPCSCRKRLKRSTARGVPTVAVASVGVTHTMQMTQTTHGTRYIQGGIPMHVCLQLSALPVSGSRDLYI